jgi:hypothetical protein
MIVAHRASGDALGCHLLRSVLSFGEFISRGEKARRIFRQLERLVSQARVFDTMTMIELNVGFRFCSRW